MYKKIFKIFLKCIIVILPFSLVLIYTGFCRFDYMDLEFPIWQQQHDYVNKKNDKTEVLVFGDSSAKSAFIPQDISLNLYNLALGGGTSIEMYYSLLNYMNNHKKPKAVFIAFSPRHYMLADSFWHRTVYFHYLSNRQFLEVLRNAHEIDKENAILIDGYKKEYLYYRYYLHRDYRGDVKSSIHANKNDYNRNFYNKLNKLKGNPDFVLPEYSDALNMETQFKAFKKLNITEYYYFKLIELCEKNSIPVVIEQIPMNRASYMALNPNFVSGFTSYMDFIQKKYPEIIVNKELSYYDNDKFGDDSHMNNKGLIIYSRYIKNKYKKYFI